MKLRTLFAALTISTAMTGAASADISGNVVKIGVLTDMSGPFSHQTGPGSVAGAELAIAEIEGKIGDATVELVFADHQNKPDVALNLARQWLDVDGVDLIVDLASSAVALAVQEVVKEKNRMVIFSGPGTDRLTNDACSPNGIHWTYDTYATGHSMAKAVIDSGGTKWFFIGLDSAFGRSIVEVMSDAIRKASGEVVGEVWHPTGANDYSSFIMQAQSSGADVLVLANSGTDFVRAVKQAREFGIDGEALRLIGPAISMADILALGPEDSQGLHYIDAFYWNLNDQTRELTNAFREKRNAIPAQAQAGVYSAVRSYLGAVAELKSDDAQAIMEKLRSTEISDGFTPSGKVRADGRMVHDMYLMRAKGPDAPKSTDWDAVELVATVAGDDAYRPLADSKCSLVK